MAINTRPSWPRRRSLRLQKMAKEGCYLASGLRRCTAPYPSSWEWKVDIFQWGTGSPFFNTMAQSYGRWGGRWVAWAGRKRLWTDGNTQGSLQRVSHGDFWWSWCRVQLHSVKQVEEKPGLGNNHRISPVLQWIYGWCLMSHRWPRMISVVACSRTNRCISSLWHTPTCSCSGPTWKLSLPSGLPKMLWTLLWMGRHPFWDWAGSRGRRWWNCGLIQSLWGLSKWEQNQWWTNILQCTKDLEK